MLPNFIIIGAAKAGTTALYHYLREHPQTFLSPLKETNYFAYGLDDRGQFLYGVPGVHQFPIKTLPEYERLFADSGNAAAIGEASPIYLECPQAAGRIRAVLPGAKIICSLRHPVDRAYSDYQMYLRSRNRPLDPATHLTTTAAWTQPDSHWMEIGRYYEQLCRYYDAFPRSQIYTFLFDDFTRDALGVTRDIYRFLGVDPAFTPDMTTPHNLGGMPKSRVMERLFTNSSLKSVLEPLVPAAVANWARRLRTRNLTKAPKLPSALKKELTRHFKDDIVRTSQLIGRNLDHWL
jgi:hypothetical protein